MTTPQSLCHVVTKYTLISCATVLTGCTLFGETQEEQTRVAEIDRKLRLLIGANCLGEYAEACASVPDPHIIRIRNSLLSKRIEISEAKFEACLAAERADTRGDRVSIFNDEQRGRNALPDCRGLWIPRVPPGELCDTDFACIDGYCDREPYTREAPLYGVQECGICRQNNAAGEECTVIEGWAGGNQRNCEPGVACACTGETCRCEPDRCLINEFSRTEECPSTAEHCVYGASCVAKIEDGETCDGQVPCRSACIDGVCGRRGLGEPCEYDWYCQGDAYCSNGICTATTSSSYCSINDPLVECADDSVCVELAEAEIGEGGFHSGRCISPGARGEPCPTTEPGGCAAGTLCLGQEGNEHCLVPSGPGEDCTEDAMCAYGRACSDGTCIVPQWLEPGPPYCVLPPT